jgi:hypothetical protein
LRDNRPAGIREIRYHFALSCGTHRLLTLRASTIKPTPVSGITTADKARRCLQIEPASGWFTHVDASS